MRWASRALAAMAFGAAVAVGGEPEVVEAAEDGRAVGAVFEAGWLSRYVTEGRDNLESGGLAVVSAEVVVGGVNVGVWHGHGDSVDYDETNLYAGYVRGFGNFQVFGGVNALFFEPEGESDFEIFAGGEWVAGAWAVGAEVVYSVEAGGAFLETAVARDWETGFAGVVVTPYVAVGVDAGYASADHDGLSHAAAGIAAACPLGRGVSVRAFAEQVLALEDVDRGGGGDVAWFGVGIAAEF